MVDQHNYRELFEWVHHPSNSRIFLLAFLVAGCGLLHAYHVSTMFENDTYFSHLTTLEREMVFRSEMGMYYSFYKRLIYTDDYFDALLSVLNDTGTEYPNVINSLKRFNLYPEVMIAGLYHVTVRITNALDMKPIQCYVIKRAYDDVTSCVGFGEHSYFYLNVVWICAGLTLSLLFLFGCELSGSIMGGLFTVLCFMYNHTEATRVQWTPPLRESFGYPSCLWQILVMTKFLRFSNSYRAIARNEKRFSTWVSDIIRLMFPTALFLILWQFSQFVVMTQLSAVLILYCLGVIKRRTCMVIALSFAGAIILASTGLFLNEFLLFSTLTYLVISVIIVLYLDMLYDHLSNSHAVVTCFLAALFTFTFKLISASEDDAHIYNLLKSKFTPYKDFHTLLYTCSPEFDFLSFEYIMKLSRTLLLPVNVVTVTVFIASWAKLLYQAGYDHIKPRLLVRVIDAGLAYNFLQAGAFAIMAALIMRLKLFLTPHLCLLASLIFHRRFFPRISKPWFATFFTLLLGGMTIQGYNNLVRERSIMGEFNNQPLEEMLSWVMDATKPNAVFAGPMPLMANIMLSTGRIVVNHPHYEHVDARRRTMQVYSIFSRKDRFDVFDLFVKMKVQYVALEDIWCFGNPKPGCSMGEIWDIEDPENINKNLLCPDLYNKNSLPFRKVFTNGVYVVFRVDPQWSTSRIHPAYLLNKVNVVNISVKQYS